MADLRETRREQMFPKLTPAQIDRLEGYGKRVRIRAGEVLAEPGERYGRLLVVLSGAIEIVLPGIADSRQAILPLEQARKAPPATGSARSTASIARSLAGAYEKIRPSDVLTISRATRSLAARELALRASRTVREVAQISRGERSPWGFIPRGQGVLVADC